MSSLPPNGIPPRNPDAPDDGGLEPILIFIVLAYLVSYLAGSCSHGIERTF